MPKSTWSSVGGRPRACVTTKHARPTRVGVWLDNRQLPGLGPLSRNCSKLSGQRPAAVALLRLLVSSPKPLTVLLTAPQLPVERLFPRGHRRQASPTCRLGAVAPHWHVQSRAPTAPAAPAPPAFLCCSPSLPILLPDPHLLRLLTSPSEPSRIRPLLLPPPTLLWSVTATT